MPSASILFIVPEDAAHLSETLADFGAENGLGGCTDAEEIREFLSGRVGQAADVDFDAEDDPMEPIDEVAAALEKVGAPYWGVYDAFTERSRGIRVPGRIVLNMTGAPGDRKEFRVSWEDGPPSIDAASLKNAGLDALAVEEVEAKFFASPAPSPGR